MHDRYSARISRLVLLLMARLHSIRIAGWKSIQNIVPNLELGSINVLIGANGSGKSNLVSFFKLMNELVNERLQTYIGQSGGANSVLHLWIEDHASHQRGAGFRDRKSAASTTS